MRPPKGLCQGKTPSRYAALYNRATSGMSEEAEQALVKASPAGPRCRTGLCCKPALSFAVGGVAREGLDSSFKMMPFPERRNLFPCVAFVYAGGTDLSAWPDGGFDFTVVFGT